MSPHQKTTKYPSHLDPSVLVLACLLNVIITVSVVVGLGLGSAGAPSNGAVARTA